MKKKIYIEFVFLFVLFLYAVIITHGHTIAWGLVPLFYAMFKNSNLLVKFSKKDFITTLLLFLIIFLINFCFVFNFSNNELNVPHPDFHFYLKVASAFNKTGIENNLTAKLFLFDNLDFSTPYRFFDTWLLSLMLKILPFSDFIILQLIYMPTLYFIVSFSIYRNIGFINNTWTKIILSISFLFLFSDYITNLLIFSMKEVGELSVISYPKLAIIFSVFIYFIRNQLSQKTKNNSILILAFLPILIQVTFPIYILIYLFIIFNYQYFIKNKLLIISIVFSTLYYLGYYYYNSTILKELFQMNQFQIVNTAGDYIHRLLSITYNLIKSRLAFFIIIFILLYYFSSRMKRLIYLRVLILSVGIIISGLLVYAFMPSSPNSYQFLSNFTFPLVISFIFFIWIDVFTKLDKKYYILNYFGLLCLVVSGIYNQYYNNSFFGSSEINDPKFEIQASKILNDVKNQIGLTYWSDKFEKSNKYRSRGENFNQKGTAFLIKNGGEFDVVCLSILKSKEKSFAADLNKHYSAIGLFKRMNKLPEESIELKFYNAYNFEYLISNLKKDQLPSYLSNDIEYSIYDKNSTIFCHKLNKNKLRKVL